MPHLGVQNSCLFIRQDAFFHRHVDVGHTSKYIKKIFPRETLLGFEPAVKCMQSQYVSLRWTTVTVATSAINIHAVLLSMLSQQSGYFRGRAGAPCVCVDLACSSHRLDVQYPRNPYPLLFYCLYCVYPTVYTSYQLFSSVFYCLCCCFYPTIYKSCQLFSSAAEYNSMKQSAYYRSH